MLRRVALASARRRFDGQLAVALTTRRQYVSRLSLFTIATFGLCSFFNTLISRPIKADARRESQSPVSDARIQKLRSSTSSGTYTAIQPEHARPGEQKPPSQSADSSSESSGRSWNDYITSIGNIKWTSMPDQLTDLLIPSWLRMMPGFITKLQSELSMAPGSLAEEIWQEANDPECNPEILWDATVRVSEDLCREEMAFLSKRKHHTVKALARYLGIPEQHIHPDDVPVIAMCGSGGGLRALVAGSGSYIASREAGLFDCITYTAGVSGSCWLQTLYFSSIGKQSHDQVIQHLKNRLGMHIANPSGFLPLLTSQPTNKFLLAGVVEKAKGSPDADFGIVDVFGTLLSSRLLVPKAELGVDFEDLKISSQQRYIDQGQHPLPIYTAVRHEIPPGNEHSSSPVSRKDAWFQWFEFSPYEFWCEEVGAGIPIWALGRQFDAGKTVWRENGLSLPEFRVPLLLGIWGSAFCATLSHYYKEVRPVMRGLAGFAGIDQLIAERDEDLVKVHPIDPAAIPNFARGMDNMLPSSCPKSLMEATHLQLMDAGMSNNLPIYPLLRPGREVDIVIAFDASADVKTDNWLQVVDGYARQRNIKGWPVGAGWPPAIGSPQEASEDLKRAQAQSEKDAERSLEKAKHADSASADRPPGHGPKDLGYCNVWIGSTSERKSTEEPPPSKLVSEDSELQKPDAGITVIYFPYLANPKVDGVDPKSSDYLSTWNFIYKPEQIDSTVALARANFSEGKDQTKRAIRAVYERKKQLRIEREKSDKDWKRGSKLRSGMLRGRKLGEGDHGDHFS